MSDAAAGHEANGPLAPGTWREVAREGRYEDAERLRAIAVGEGIEVDDDEERRALATLAAVQSSLRSKTWRTAARRAAESTANLAGIDGDRVRDDAAVLADAGAALERREVDVAVELLTPLGERPPGPFESERLTQLGTARILDGDDAAAKSCFEQALALDPRHTRALVNLGNVALEAGEVDAAIEHYQAALRIDETFANAHHNLGVAYRRKGMVGKSVASLRRAQRAERRHDAREAREDVRAIGGRVRGRRVRQIALLVLAAGLAWWFFVR